MRYINKQFQLPDNFNDQYSSAKIAFAISAKGNISNIQVIRGDTLLRQTLIDLFTNSNRWIPAKVGKKAVASNQVVRFNYCLKDELN